ncbi:glycosyl hydrolase family 18 protein [Alkalihalobacterium bogoriense]|uniref:glycosyl hydrolase family 18 protein n=1 Tax=Alkalihalobacterium bogoriense TaxID=246272 RepID=UPI0006868993|nr:glycosyl hydrolase family 18 protein [Alkalihalobacterium bogoriense]
MKKMGIFFFVFILLFSFVSTSLVVEASKGNNGRGNSTEVRGNSGNGNGNNNNNLTPIVEEEVQPIQEEKEDPVVEPIQEPTPIKDEPPLEEPVKPEFGAVFTYTVKSGDTLFLLAREFGTTVETIKALNGLTSDMIFVGQTLLIPTQEVEVKEEEKKKPLMILGYYTKYWETDRNSYQSLVDHHDLINTIATATFDINRNGTISGYYPREGVQFANQSNVTSYATFQNHFDPELTQHVLQSEALRQTTIQNMLTVVRTENYQGLNLNFENMYASNRSLFNQFVKEAVEVFHANGYPVMVSVPAKTCDCPTWAWSGTFDFPTLGNLADYIQIMTYDQHGSWGQPGPVAGVDWVESVLRYATSTMPNEKLLIGLPAYGYDWNVTKGTGHRALTWKQIKALQSKHNADVKWQASSQSPSFEYIDEAGDKHIVWFENTASIVAKTKLVEQYNLAGVSMWRMGQEDREFWEAVHSVLK